MAECLRSSPFSAVHPANALSMLNLGRLNIMHLFHRFLISQYLQPAEAYLNRIGPSVHLSQPKLPWIGSCSRGEPQGKGQIKPERWIVLVTLTGEVRITYGACRGDIFECESEQSDYIASIQGYKRLRMEYIHNLDRLPPARQG